MVNLDLDNDNNDLVEDMPDRRYRRRGAGRTPTCYREPPKPRNLPPPLRDDSRFKVVQNRKNQFIVNYKRPDYIISARFDEDDQLKYACAWKNSKEIKWVSSNEINKRCPRLIIEYYNRPTEYYSSEENDDCN